MENKAPEVAPRLDENRKINLEIARNYQQKLLYALSEYNAKHRSNPENHLVKLQESLPYCFAFAERRVYAKDGYEKFITRSCKSRACPVCAHKLSVTRTQNFAMITHKLGFDFERDFQNGFYKFVTISPKNNKNLNDALAICRKIRSHFLSSDTKRQWLSKKHGVLGAFLMQEVTRNHKPRSKDYLTWHPHFHALIFVNPDNPNFQPNPIPRYDSEGNEKGFYDCAWSYNLHRDLAENGIEAWVTCETPRSGNPFECFKYACKPMTEGNKSKSSGLKPFEIIEVLKAIRGSRVFWNYGIFRGVDLDNENLTDHGTEYWSSWLRWVGNELQESSAVFKVEAPKPPEDYVSRAERNFKKHELQRLKRKKEQKQLIKQTNAPLAIASPPLTWEQRLAAFRACYDLDLFSP